MLDDSLMMQKFFGTYLRDTAVRAALWLAGVIGQLHGCTVEEFPAEVLKAASHPEFTPAIVGIWSRNNHAYRLKTPYSACFDRMVA